VKCIFSVDVEDWFHILDVPSSPAVSEWDGLPSRAERNFLRLLDLFGESNVRVTCFFLGWVAQKFPHLVREAGRRGHEIASHGYAHLLAYEAGPRAFHEDAVRSRAILEDIAGHKVRGYRSAGFSVTETVPWFFEKLAESGYQYDSSVFPARRGHGGLPNGRLEPHVVSTSAGSIVEFPVTVASVIGRPMCFFGGGYLRLSPLPLVRAMARRVLSEGRPVIFYVHPREIDPRHPRLPMSRVRAFKSYVNLSGAEAKLRSLLREFEFTTFEAFVEENFQGAGLRVAAAHAV
jgi:polysaccharide deacetylase family protein (PEP-CTERM system associated)